MANTFDFVIVGAGTAGCGTVMKRQLRADRAIAAPTVAGTWIKG